MEGRMNYGRFLSPIDRRDWKLSQFLTTKEKLTLSLKSKQWSLDFIPDQGNTGHCGGFSGLNFLNCLPVDDNLPNQVGHDLYYEAKVFDGEPKQENGTCMRSVAKAVLARKRIGGYAFTKNILTLIAWLQQRGPVLTGTNWYYSMEKPDKNGYVHPTGELAGGHAYALIGVDPKRLTFVFANSWGSAWGQKGTFKMYLWDFARLLSEAGEVVTAVELPL
jgi:hypothetical protein